jgi:hypothetical protein
MLVCDRWKTENQPSYTLHPRMGNILGSMNTVEEDTATIPSVSDVDIIFSSFASY